MKRILCIVGGMTIGGAETFLMKLYRAIDKEKYQFDFAVANPNECAYDREIISMGGRIFHITPKTKGPIKNFREIKDLVKREKFDYVMRVSQNSLSALELLAARMGGAGTTVFRSSNSDPCAGTFNRLVHRMCSFMPRKFANVHIAPSTPAAEFMFGKDAVEKGNAHLLHNAIDFDTYRFTPERREALRKELGIGSEPVFGHIGRFNFQKNHRFIIEIFNEIKKLKPESKLVLVGIGELEDEILDLVKAKGLDKDVVFTGSRTDACDFYSAFDVMLFPSLFEGMPNTVIEAQASGLPCLVSDTVTPECRITDRVEFLGLEEAASEWAAKAVERLSYPRSISKEAFDKTGYCIDKVVEEFINLVFENK